jgi:PAS domain S-box-containing protein
VNLLRLERESQGPTRSLQIPDLFVLLSQEKERLDYIMRSVPVGILLTNPEGVIALANHAVGAALGLTDVELREKKMFGSRQAGRTVRGLIQQSQAEGKPVTTPYEMEGRWFQIQVIPWAGGGQFLVVTQDIHDWFQLNRLKEDLISIISHEVKNPLTAVLNATHLLSSERAGPLNVAQARVATLIQENSEQIKSLLDDVVRLSRVYHMNVRQEPVALLPLVKAVHDRSLATLKGKLISWTESLEELTVHGDGAMLESLLVNLIGNAVKYTGIGGHVGVRLWSDGAWARLRVVDDGPGIPADEKDRLFSPFFRASNVKDQVAGTGLGLVISRNIAERLGGALTVVSPIPSEDAAFLGRVRPAARGSAFQVELPLAR